MLSDYHLHTDFSGDSETPAKAQIEQAIRLGMDSLCITDHHDYDVESIVDFNLDIDRYMTEMLELKEEYQGLIDVRIGIELGLQVHLKDYFEELVRRYPFDFIIGSTHFIDRIDPSYPEFFEQHTEQEAYRKYFETTLKNVTQLEDYDVAGHIDYLVRYGPNKTAFYSQEDYCDIIDAILKAILEHGKGIECNTAGFRKGIAQPNPAVWVLKRYRELGGEIITIGSDAHTPEDIGGDFKRAEELLKACGFTHYTVFRQRKPVFLRF